MGLAKQQRRLPFFQKYWGVKSLRMRMNSPGTFSFSAGDRFFSSG